MKKIKNNSKHYFTYLLFIGVVLSFAGYKLAMKYLVKKGDVFLIDQSTMLNPIVTCGLQNLGVNTICGDGLYSAASFICADGTSKKEISSDRCLSLKDWQQMGLAYCEGKCLSVPVQTPTPMPTSEATTSAFTYPSPSLLPSFSPSPSSSPVSTESATPLPTPQY